VQWSLDLLSPDGLALLRLVTSFRTPFGAEAVDELYGRDASALLASLTESSLVRRDDDVYRLPAAVRQHVLDALSPQEREELARAHAEWAAGASTRGAEELYGGDELAARTRLLGLVPEFRVAFEQLVADGRDETAARMVLDLAQIWFHAGRAHEAGEMLGRVIDAADLTPRTRAETMALRGIFAKMTGDADTIHLMTSGAEGLRIHAPDSIALVNTLCHLADAHLSWGDRDLAVALADEAVATAAKRVGDETTLSVAWDLVGYIARGVGDRERAVSAARVAVEEARRIESAALPESLAGLAASLGPGEPEALDLAFEALALTETGAQRTQRAKVIVDAAEVVAAVEPETAARLLSEALAIYLATGMTADIVTAVEQLAGLTADLDPAATATMVAATVRRCGDSLTATVSRLRESLGPAPYARAAAQAATLDDDDLSRLAATLAGQVR
jgi:hypothetical protein